jgi:hypothetical protein
MAEDINYSIKVDTGGVDKATNAINNFGKATKQAVSNTSDKLGGLSEKFESMPGPIGNVANSLGGLGKSMMALVTNPLGAVLAGLVGVFMTLRAALKQTDEGMDSLEQLTSAFGAVLNPVIQAVSKFASVLVGGLAKGLELVTSLFTDAATQGANLAKVQQDLDDVELQLAESRAAQNKTLAEARELLSDANATLQERRKALKQVADSETDLATKELKYAQDRLKAARLDQRLNGETEESKKKVSDAVIQVANAETDLAAKRRLFNREQKKLDAEEKAAAKEKADKAKEYAEARKAASDKIRELEQQNIIASIQGEERRAVRQAEIDLENAKRQIERGKYTKKEKNRLIEELDEQHQLKLTQISVDGEKKRNEELKAFQDKAASDEQSFIDLQYEKRKLEIERTINDEKQLQEALYKLEADRIQNQIQAAKDAGKDTTELESQLLANYKATNKFKQESDKQTAENKKKVEAQALDAVSQALGGVIDLVGAESKWGKSLAVGQAIINTYLGASKAIAEGGVAGPILAAGVIASGLAQVRQITMTKLPDPPSEFGGGGGGDAGASIPTPSFGPSVGIVSGQMGNNAQLANAFGGVMKQPIKAYAVGQDMTSQQSLDRHINQNATLGK